MHIAQGQLAALAVMSAQRSEFMPHVPTTAEAGFPALLAEGQAVGEYLRSAEARTAFRPLGVTPAASTADELGALVAREHAQ